MTKALPLLEETLTLSNGLTIPRVQLGVYMMSRSECRTSVPWALETGYRAVDCAQMYHNEREAGQGITSFLSSDKNSQKLTRKDIFYTTKLASNDNSYDRVRREIKKSVEACGLGYVDLFLLHSPYGGRQARLTSWNAVEDAIADGEVRMGGVSNYGVAHIEELMGSKPKTPPVINQIEVHPFNTQTGIRETCAKYGIAIEAYAPLARGMRMKHPKILELAKYYGCTPAQVFVKWGLQHGLITLPKTTKKERLRENVDVSGFTISDQHMSELDELDERLVTDWDPTEAP